MDEVTIVFVEEFGISCSTRVKYGRSPKWTTSRKNIRAIRLKNLSASAAVNKKHVITFEVKDRAYNGKGFLEFIKINCFANM